MFLITIMLIVGLSHRHHNIDREVSFYLFLGGIGEGVAEINFIYMYAVKQGLI